MQQYFSVHHLNFFLISVILKNFTKESILILLFCWAEVNNKSFLHNAFWIIKDPYFLVLRSLVLLNQQWKIHHALVTIAHVKLYATQLPEYSKNFTYMHRCKQMYQRIILYTKAVLFNCFRFLIDFSKNINISFASLTKRVHLVHKHWSN